MLNSPGESIVLSNEFLNLLDRLDVSLDYLKANVSVQLLFRPWLIRVLDVTEIIQRRRDLLDPLPAMPHSLNDAHQNVFRQYRFNPRQRSLRKDRKQSPSLHSPTTSY